MSISQSIDAPITTRDTVSMSGSMSAHNGNAQGMLCNHKLAIKNLTNNCSSRQFSGGFLICGRRLINQGWFEFVAGAGNGPVIGVKGSRNLTNKVFCNGDFTLNFRKNGIIPGIVGSEFPFPFITEIHLILNVTFTNKYFIFEALAVQLDKHTVGYLTYNAGLQSSVSCVLEHSTEKQHLLLTGCVGIPHSFISASYTKKLPDYELKLRLAAK